MADRSITLNLRLFELAKGFSLAFLFRLTGLALGFALSIWIARMVGADGVGLLALATTCTGIGSVIGRAGLDNALLRFVAEAVAVGDMSRAAGASRKGLVYASGGALTVTAVLYPGSEWLASAAFSEPAVAPLIRILSLAILPLTLCFMFSQLLQSLKKAGWSTLVQTNLIPLFTIAGLAVIALAGMYPVAVDHVAMVMVGSNLVVALLGWRLWRQFTPEIRRAPPVFATGELFSTGIPLLWVASMNLVIGWTDTIMLGVLADSSSVGIYSTASRMATLASLVLIAANTIVSPEFAALHARGDFANLQRIAQLSARTVTVITLPLLAVFFFAPSMVMSIYGQQFAEGGPALAVLSIAQLVNLMSGSVVYLLMMTGRQKSVSRAMTVAAIGNVALNAMLIPAYGLLGACIATAISMSVINIALVWVVWRQLGIVSAIFPTYRIAEGKPA